MALYFIIPDPDVLMVPGPWDVRVFCVGLRNVQQMGPPTIPTTADASVVPSADTYRGGAAIVLPAESLGPRNVTRDALLTGATLPSGWTPISSAPAAQHHRGIVTRAQGSGGVSGLRAPDVDYFGFDVAVDVEVLTPTSNPSARVEVATLEHIASTTTARVSIERDATSGAAYAVGVLAGDSSGGRVPLPDNAIVTLRLVRGGARIFGFVGVRDRYLGADSYTTLAKVLDHPMPTPWSGSISLLSRSLTAATTVSARWSNYTVRAHAVIADRLLDNKVHRRDGQLIGNVPAATIQEVGAVPVSLFGLHGTSTVPNGFTYSLPAFRSVQSGRGVRFYSDVQVKDTA